MQITAAFPFGQGFRSISLPRIIDASELFVGRDRTFAMGQAVFAVIDSAVAVTLAALMPDGPDDLPDQTLDVPDESLLVPFAVASDWLAAIIASLLRFHIAA